MQSSTYLKAIFSFLIMKWSTDSGLLVDSVLSGKGKNEKQNGSHEVI